MKTNKLLKIPNDTNNLKDFKEYILKAVEAKKILENVDKYSNKIINDIFLKDLKSWRLFLSETDYNNAIKKIENLREYGRHNFPNEFFYCYKSNSLIEKYTISAPTTGCHVDSEEIITFSKDGCKIIITCIDKIKKFRFEWEPIITYKSKYTINIIEKSVTASKIIKE